MPASIVHPVSTTSGVPGSGIQLDPGHADLPDRSAARLVPGRVQAVRRRVPGAARSQAARPCCRGWTATSCPRSTALRRSRHAARALLHGRRDREARRALRRQRSPTATSWRSQAQLHPEVEDLRRARGALHGGDDRDPRSTRPGRLDHEPEVGLHDGDARQGGHGRCRSSTSCIGATATSSWWSPT